MSDVLKEIDEILNGSVHSVFVGRSATDYKRFATIRKGAGETVSTGRGDTAQAALEDALRNMRGGRKTITRPVDFETPVLPGMEVRMPL